MRTVTQRVVRVGMDFNQQAVRARGDGGGAQIITWGGFDVAAGLEMYGSQIIAAGPIAFAANADGIQGASMVSGETIDGTSNMSLSVRK